MKNRKILCVGEVLWDSLPAGMFPGGAPFNAACHLHGMGEDVAMVSRIGDDENGRGILAEMEKRNMNTRFLQKDETRPTGLVSVRIDDWGNPSYNIVNPSAWDFIEAEKELLELAAESSVIVYGSLAQRNRKSRETINKLLDIVPLRVFDVNLRAPYDDPKIVRESLMKSVIAKLNETEFYRIAAWFGLPEVIRTGAEKISEVFGCKTVCITRGENGAALWHKGEWTEHLGFSVAVKDTVGAGDAFLAAFIQSVLDGRDSMSILERSNRAGSFVAGCTGAIPVIDNL